MRKNDKVAGDLCAGAARSSPATSLRGREARHAVLERNRTGLTELRRKEREEGGNDFCLGDGVLKQWMLTMPVQIGVPVEGSEGEGRRNARAAECLMRATGPSKLFLSLPVTGASSHRRI